MLLNTFDIDVLRQVLHFMIRPAQRINNPRAIRSSFVVPQDKIVELARGWNNVPVDLLRIAQDLEVTPKMMTLNIQFYRTTASTSTTTTENSNNEAQTEGHQVVTYLINDKDMEKDDIDIFLKLVKEHDIPKEYQFELANRIRIAKHMKQADVRRKLLGIRILAICIMCK
jgi:E3 ubiquitin-protein ligase HUWE1